MEALAKEFNAIGLATDTAVGRQHGLVVIKQYAVQAGPHAGKTIDVAVHGADFPFTPPAGIHIRGTLGVIGQRNVSQSPLGGEWQYWSRRLNDWQKDRSARHIISYVNKVLLDG